MKIIVDERETLLFEQCNLLLTLPNSPYKNIQLIKKVLDLGDFILTRGDDEPVAIIERKTLQDLLASIKDGRYEEQSYRLANTVRDIPVFYLIEGTISSLRNEQEKRLVYSVMASLHFFKGFQTLRTHSYLETAEMLICMTDKIQRNLQKGIPLKRTVSQASQGSQGTMVPECHTSDVANYCTVVKKVKKENITPENIGEIILSQIPGISSVTAVAIMKHFSSISNLIDELKKNPARLENIQYETNGKLRKINRTCIQSIITYLIPA
jgi:ERCC4-type nuclease